MRETLIRPRLVGRFEILEGQTAVVADSTREYVTALLYYITSIHRKRERANRMCRIKRKWAGRRGGGREKVKVMKSAASVATETADDLT